MVIPRKVWNLNFWFHAWHLDGFVYVWLFLIWGRWEWRGKGIKYSTLACPSALAATGVHKDSGRWTVTPASVNQVSLELTCKWETGRWRLASSGCSGAEQLLREGKQASQAWISFYSFSSGNSAPKKVDEDVKIPSYFKAIWQFFL